MTVKKSVFGSKGEERGFRSIEHTWGEQYRVFPQFPFSALFEPDESIRDTSNLFFKTSIDYVLCTKAGQPLLAIDFDGLGKGFNRDGKYIQVKKTSDRFRKPKFDFKLQYAKRSEFPYYVVASDEFEHLDPEIELTVVDGIIGTVLAKRDFDDRIPALVEEHRDTIEDLPSQEKDEYIQDLVIYQEVMSDNEYNPITKRVAQIRGKIDAISGSTSWKEDYRTYEESELPELDGLGPFSSAESLTARLAAMSRVESVRCVCTLSYPEAGRYQTWRG